MQKSQLPFKALFEQIISDLAGEQCVALAGLSNSGKSTLMRALASPQAEAEYSRRRKRNGALVYIDCNRAVAISAQAFYEVVIRSLLEH
jgi:ABC-type phosphate/phosphonate transport system ATPase subunit